MKWLELTVYTTDAGTDAVCAAFSLPSGHAPPRPRPEIVIKTCKLT